MAELARKIAWLRKEQDGLCADCGRLAVDPQFDHNPYLGPKLFNVTDLKYHSLNELKAERAKCSLLCKTCHEARTAWRQAQAITVACPDCGAEPGRLCFLARPRTRNGKTITKRHTVHKIRQAEALRAMAAGDIPDPPQWDRY